MSSYLHQMTAAQRQVEDVNKINSEINFIPTV